MIYIHPTLASKPARLAMLERQSGLQAFQGRVYGVLMNPGHSTRALFAKKAKPTKPKCWFKEEVRKALNEILAIPSSDFPGGDAA